MGRDICLEPWSMVELIGRPLPGSMPTTRVRRLISRMILSEKKGRRKTVRHFESCFGQ